MTVLLPISLDTWKYPIAALLRACVIHNPQIEFHAFSKPVTSEDHEHAPALWALPNLKKVSPLSVLLRRYDLVHTASCSPGNLRMVRLALWRGAGHTRFLHTLNLESDEAFPLALENLLKVISLKAWLVAVSRAVAAEPLRRTPEKFLGVIPNGFDPFLFNPEEPVDWDTIPGELRSRPRPFVLSVASLEPRKHPEVIIQLARANPEITFVCAGAVTRGVSDPFLPGMLDTRNILWLGSIEQRVVRELLKLASVLAFPSDREGLPLAVIEALGMGVPVLAQPLSSLPELVRHGENGLLIPAGDVPAWSEGIKMYLAMDEGRRTELGRSIRETTLAAFAWNKVGEAYGPVYRKLGDDAA